MWLGDMRLEVLPLFKRRKRDGTVVCRVSWKCVGVKLVRMDELILVVPDFILIFQKAPWYFAQGRHREIMHFWFKNDHL